MKDRNKPHLLLIAPNYQYKKISFASKNMQSFPDGYIHAADIADLITYYHFLS